MVDLDTGMWICTSAMRRLPSVMQGGDEPASLGQEEGWVR
jgi:hypothetical protein